MVIELVRTISSSESISSKDYERIKDTSKQLLEQVQAIDPQIHPQLNLSSKSNFVLEIRNRTRSGFGPDLIITDSDTALELYRHRLLDPIELSDHDREAVARQQEKVLQNTPPAAFKVDFADSSVNYKLLFWVRNPLEAFAVGRDLRQAIWTAFEQNGIGILFPSGRCSRWNDPHPKSKPTGSAALPTNCRPKQETTQLARRRR